MRKKMDKWRVLAAALVLHGFLQLCGAVDLSCTVTHDGPKTTYTVLHEFPASTHCSWSNSTDHVIAVLGSNNTLVISGCINKILFAATSDSPVTDYKATCSTNCTGAALPQVPDTFPWITAWILIPIGILILLLAGFWFLCPKFRDGIRRRCCCSQVGGFYTAAVMMNNPEPQVVVV